MGDPDLLCDSSLLDLAVDESIDESIGSEWVMDDDDDHDNDDLVSRYLTGENSMNRLERCWMGLERVSSLSRVSSCIITLVDIS